jgi:hypothetical protein
VTDDDWERHRDRSILAAFQTGRPVFGDANGVLRYADGDREPLADDVGLPRGEMPRATAHELPIQLSWWKRLKRRFRGAAGRE